MNTSIHLMDSRIQKCQFTETLGRSAQSGVNVAYITSESGVKISEMFECDYDGIKWDGSNLIYRNTCSLVSGTTIVGRRRTLAMLLDIEASVLALMSSDYMG